MNDIAMKEALDSLSEETDPSTFTAANGLRLKLKRVSQMIIADANRRMKPPTPPVTWNEDKQRNEENLMHPDFLRAQKDYQYDIAMLAMRVYYILGTEVDGVLPSSVDPVTSNAWVDRVQAVDPEIDIPESGPRRYLAWLRLHALPDEDQLRLLNAIVRFSGGVLEDDVKAAQDSFRGDKGRDTPVTIPPTTENPRRSGNAEPLGDSPRNGGEGSSGLRAVPSDDVDLNGMV